MEKINEMNGLTSKNKIKIVTIVNDQWYFMHSSMHYAGIVFGSRMVRERAGKG
jgi:hypothetical protein